MKEKKEEVTKIKVGKQRKLRQPRQRAQSKQVNKDIRLEDILFLTFMRYIYVNY